MQTKTSPGDRLVMALVTVAAGILLFTLVPASAMNAMTAVLAAAYAKIAATGNQSIIWAPKLVSFFFPFWAGLSAVGGAALLLLALPVYRGERWARATAMGVLAIPSVGGAYMIGPIMFFDKTAAMQSVAIMLTGLLPYFTLLLAERSAAKTKVANLFVFLSLGVSAAYNWSNGHSAMRQLLSRPDPKIFTVGHQTWALGITANWAATILILVGIPLLAARHRSGWWLNAVGSLAMIVGSSILAVGHGSTVEFKAGVAMAVLALILLLLPGVGGRLMGSDEAEPAQSRQAV